MLETEECNLLVQRMNNKRGQLTLNEAPNIVVIIGLVFLLMATLAYVGVKFGDAIATPTTTSIVNESVTTVNEQGDTLTFYYLRNGVCSVTSVFNVTNSAPISATNYTVSNCVLSVSDDGGAGLFNNTDWLVSYNVRYDEGGVATNVTDDMNTNISDNTSIAGIVLTISLVGIVLAVLIGIFVIARNRGM